MEIWINPSCSKCRAAKADLDAAGVAYTERRYLDDPPSPAELTEVLARLGLEPWDIARPAESREAGITHPKDAEHREDWIRSLSGNPRAIQRPIITADDGSAYVARDPETVRQAIDRG
ncbi:MAG: arsenate reductase [Nocardioidaceae bacterium]|nr:MAG: arsenate reductase [Nocardioidaceae bacterium]